MTESKPRNEKQSATGAAKVPYPSQRHQLILDRLRAAGRVDVADVVTDLAVTNETIRKDLIELERRGLLRRVHGGAVPVGQLTYEPPVSSRVEYRDEKRRIARAALAHLPEGGAVLIDAGSTTAELVDIFPDDRDVTVYTNTLTNAVNLVQRSRVTVMLLGGRVRPVTMAGVGDWTARALSEINVDVAFLGANAISIDRGLTTPDSAEAATKRLMLDSAQRRILLADHTKLGRVSLCKHADLADIDLFITDEGIPAAELKALRASGLTVELT
ncbi:MAG: putative transcriptional regulator, DeoR family [Aeromicrobium sp.]|jgi:DeoR family fructose operon transcriptional repressor|nr:putative transcriptional regulator, DeoR family [Aeromicrobium sp.]